MMATFYQSADPPRPVNMVRALGAAFGLDPERFEQIVEAYERPEVPGFPRTVRISCPGCGRTQAAQVHFYQGDPFASFVHQCERCGYTVLESEWEEVGQPVPDRLALIEARWRERGCPDGDFAWLLAECRRLRRLLDDRMEDVR